MDRDVVRWVGITINIWMEYGFWHVGEDNEMVLIY